MTQEVKYFLDKLDQKWVPIKQQVEQYFDSDSRIRDDGALQVFKRPWIAPKNFGILVFPPANEAWLTMFQEKTTIVIPTIYKKILMEINGCYIYDFELFGLPKSLYTGRLLDRSILQQHDLTLANNSWKKEYKLNEDYFLIGGRDYADDEVIGYFLNENKIYSIRKNGEILSSWDSFVDFLNEEIYKAERTMLNEKNKTIR